MSAASDDEPLKREIGFFGSAFLSFNGLVGAGIFVLPGTLHDRFGAFSPLLFPLFGLVFLVIAFPFARVSAHFAQTGGPVAYAARFGPIASFQAGWLYYVARVAALAANATVFATYLGSYWPWVSGGIGRAMAILSMLAITTGINIAGVRRAIRFLDALTLLKAAPLVVLAIVALTMSAPAIAPDVPPISELEAAALLVLYAFVGFENSVVSAGETRDPRRTVPRALIGTVVATAMLYTLIQLAYAGSMRPGEGGAAPLVSLAFKTFGPIGAGLLMGAAVFSLIGNISSGMTSATRVTYALARDGLAPPWLGTVGRYATPANSILFMGTLIAVLALTGSFAWLAIVSTLARMFVYALAIAALPRLERFRLHWMAASVAGFAVCAWAAAQSDARSWLTLLALASSGLILFALSRRTGPLR